MKRYYILVLLVFAAMMAFAQGGSGLNLAAIDKQVIPEDTAVRKGVLSNGLTYYVCRNDKPAKQAFFYLLVKAGSIVEKDNERGIAHFVEHMLFKGTTHSPSDFVEWVHIGDLENECCTPVASFFALFFAESEIIATFVPINPRRQFHEGQPPCGFVG